MPLSLKGTCKTFLKSRQGQNVLLQYNWYNKASISHILQLDPITSGSVLITAKIVALKRENPEPILTVKIIEWRKFIGYSGQII